jgi:outer membrane lipase/esterase
MPCPMPDRLPLMRKTSSSTLRRARSVSRLASLTALAASLLAGCGGGTTQVDSFVPERLLVFGDELSVLTEEGLKYSPNDIDETNGQLRCQNNPIWVQELAGHYGMAFAECNPDFLANPKAKMLAVAGATSDGLTTQIREFTAGDSIHRDDLATVLVGMNDVLEAYAAFPAENEEELVRRVEAAGERTAERVNELAAAGARVLIATAPDLGVTPFARAEDDEHGNTRSALLTRLSDSFNRSMRLKLVNDGSKIGLLLLDDLLRSMVRVPGAYGLRDVEKGVCADNVTLPNCSNETLISSDNSPTPSIATYLWADDTRPSLVLHDSLGTQAINRAANNPF